MPPPTPRALIHSQILRRLIRARLSHVREPHRLPFIPVAFLPITLLEVAFHDRSPTTKPTTPSTSPLQRVSTQETTLTSHVAGGAAVTYFYSTQGSGPTLPYSSRPVPDLSRAGGELDKFSANGTA